MTDDGYFLGTDTLLDQTVMAESLVADRSVAMSLRHDESSDSQSGQDARGEPFGVRLYGVLAIVAVVTACMTSYGISTWPMADDEVPSLAELGIFDIRGESFSV